MISVKCVFVAGCCGNRPAAPRAGHSVRFSVSVWFAENKRTGTFISDKAAAAACAASAWPSDPWQGHSPHLRLKADLHVLYSWLVFTACEHGCVFSTQVHGPWTRAHMNTVRGEKKHIMFFLTLASEHGSCEQCTRVHGLCRAWRRCINESEYFFYYRSIGVTTGGKRMHCFVVPAQKRCQRGGGGRQIPRLYFWNCRPIVVLCQV